MLTDDQIDKVTQLIKDSASMHTGIVAVRKYLKKIQRKTSSKNQERTMESDSQDAIRFCQQYKITKLTVRFDKKKCWQTSLQYCCPKHQPKLMLNLERGPRS